MKKSIGYLPACSAFVLVGLLFLFLFPASNRQVRAQPEELNVLQGWVRWSGAENLLQHHWNRLALQTLEERSQQIQKLRTASDWRARQSEVSDLLLRLVGPFPEKTPLNARVTGRIQKTGFRVEKIIFESRPGFHVTGCLFLPDSATGKTPAILNVIGHTGIAFRSTSYQRLILNLVQKGFIVLAIDPIGQGERLQYYHPELKASLVGGPTSEHSYVGKQCFLSGESLANYFTWDGIRAIDYLSSRPEVDPRRIGVTGISGGGTQTSYIMAMDERVAAAAPANYICGFKRLLQSIGPQDAEQNIYEGLAHGLDHADFLEVRAPKPTLVVATTRDFFSIQGAREVVAEAEQAFSALGSPDNLALVEDDLGHGYTVKNREAIYSFFQQHLDLPGNPAEKSVDYLSHEELTVTSTGQVLADLEGETVFSLNRSAASELLEARDRKRDTELENHLDEVRIRAKELSDAPEVDGRAIFYGRWNRAGYSIEEYSIPGEGNLVTPLLWFKSQTSNTDKVILYLHPEGKSAEAEPGGAIESWVEKGHSVLSPDLSGVGELGQAGNSVTFLGVQLGLSIPGLRASDILRCIQFIRHKPEAVDAEIIGVSQGGMATPLLVASAAEPALSRIVLLEPLISFESVVLSRFFRADFQHMIPGALAAHLDLPDLEASLAPRPLLMINVQDPLLTTMSAENVEAALGIVTKSYQARGARDRFRLSQGLLPQEVKSELRSWLAQ